MLSERGVIFIHLDPTKAHYIKVIMDEIFGTENFRNEIVWRNNNAHNSATEQFGPIHQAILFYSKGNEFDLHPDRRPFTAGYIKERFKYSDKRGIYQPNYLTGPGLRSGDSGKPWGGFNPSANGRHWAIPDSIKKYLPNNGKELTTPQLLDALKDMGLLIFPKKIGGQPMYKQYMTEGILYQDLWAYHPNTQGVLYESDQNIDEDVKWLEQEDETSGYPTQKPEGVLSRILNSCTGPGSLILDCFIGSGTTAAVAQKLGRRWIGCDINKGAIQTTSKRLQTIIQEQIAERVKRKKTPELIKDENVLPEPAQYGFTIYRVNDYDLQIQHNEAVNLACEHIGVTRTKADGFFDGTLGKRLVKIAPFHHPLSPLDLEEIKKELKTRSEEQRDVMVVSLGKELAVEKWLDDWNRLRKRGDVPNKIEVVELRTDPKYGKFFTHKPATARVEINRLKSKISVEIKDFISPSVIEHLEDQSGILKPKIDDWRAMADCVMIDTAYDGKVFNVVLSDIPEKKTDLVQGAYELDPPKGRTIVAVKIVDMLGEEVLVTKELS